MTKRMDLIKYKITATKCTGFMMVVYQDNNLKSILNEFNPPLTEKQLNVMLSCIPNNPQAIKEIFNQAYPGKITVDAVKPIGAEPGIDAEAFTANNKIGLFCRLYAENHKDENGEPVKYKTGAAEAGKIKALAVGADELEQLLIIYFKSDEWYLKPKSISNFIKKYNEVRALAFAKPKVLNYPIPYSHSFFNGLDLMGKRAYQDFLKLNGFVFQHNPVRGGTWVKSNTLL